MPRLKVLFVALCAIAAVSVVSVSSASAIWMIGGKNFHGSAALATAAVVHEPTKLLIPTFEHLTITCSGSLLDGTEPRIEALDKVFAESLRFLACNTNKANCALEETNQTIPTLPILELATLGTKESVKLNVVPETKAEFADIKLSESNTCALIGLLTVKGSVNITSPDGQLELLSHLIEDLGSFENNSLEIAGAGNKAYLVGGKALLRLQSDSKWSFL
jgi:hypothetical protein